MTKGSEMTPFEQVMGALSMTETDRAPVVPNPILTRIRYAGYKVSECFRDADRLAQSQLNWLNSFGLDAAWVSTGKDDLTMSLGAKASFRTIAFP